MKKMSTLYAIYMINAISCTCTTFVGMFVDVYIHRDDLGYTMTNVRASIGFKMFYGCFSTAGKPERCSSPFIHHRHLFNSHNFTIRTIIKNKHKGITKSKNPTERSTFQICVTYFRLSTFHDKS